VQRGRGAWAEVNDELDWEIGVFILLQLKSDPMRITRRLFEDVVGMIAQGKASILTPGIFVVQK
jgi:hypothetical protein